MKEDLYIQLIHKQLAGDISSSEAAQLEAWLQEKPAHRKLHETVQIAWEASGDLDLDIELDMDTEFKQLSDRLDLPKASDETQANVRQLPKPSTNQRGWYMAAAGLLVLIAGALWLNNNYFASSGRQLMVTNLSHAVKKVSMPDGSLVFLNESSSISYPEKFGDDRKVGLSGEAYFQVEHNAQKPFIVRTTQAHEIKVLGTEFTVREEEEMLSVNVAKGKVQLSSSSSKESPILTAGMEATLNNASGEISIDKKATANADYWRTKTLRYDGQELQKVIQELEDIFHTSFAPLPASIASCSITSTFPNFKLSEILEEIATVLGAEIIQNNQDPISFSGGACR